MFGFSSVFEEGTCCAQVEDDLTVVQERTSQKNERRLELIHSGARYYALNWEVKS